MALQRALQKYPRHDIPATQTRNAETAAEASPATHRNATRNALSKSHLTHLGQKRPATRRNAKPQRT